MLWGEGLAARRRDAAADGTVRAWAIEDRQQLAEVRVDASLQCAALDRTAQRVLAGSAKRVVSVVVRMSNEEA